MSKNGLKIFKNLILFFGLAIICCAFYFMPIKEGLEEWRKNYLWICIAISYIVIFFPMFFPPKDKDSTGSAFVSGGIYFLSDGIFVLISIVLGILVYNGKFESIFWPLIIQGICLFFFLIQVYLCVFTSTHISSVSQMENQKKAAVIEIRQFAQQLTILASSLDESNMALKKELEQISNDLRYLSPSNNQIAMELESKIYVALKEIEADPIFSSTQASNVNAMKNAAEVSLLLKRRKAIY